MNYSEIITYNRFISLFLGSENSTIPAVELLISRHVFLTILFMTVLKVCKEVVGGWNRKDLAESFELKDDYDIAYLFKHTGKAIKGHVRASIYTRIRRG